jgi:hypothetical protein
MAECDKNGDNLISIEEFMDAMTNYLKMTVRDTKQSPKETKSGSKAPVSKPKGAK